jgi:hypothetical protein
MPSVPVLDLILRPTFETITLQPSVNAEGCCRENCRGWHGFITGGLVTV